MPRIRRFHKRKRKENFWWTLQQPENDECYIEAFRMSKKSFLLLCEKLECFLKNDCVPCITPPLAIEKQVAICLYKLASCGEYRVIGDVFGVHKSTVHKYFHLVVNALIQLKTEFIKFPQVGDALLIASEFEKKSHIPNIIGAIDGTHIPILPPSQGYLDYINRKGWPSIVMQGVVDSNYMFTDVSVKLPGSTHDATVFKESGLFKNSSTLIPRHTKLINGVETPLFLIGDPAYPLLPWLIKPYTGSLNAAEESFNCHLSSARIVVENAFGRLKGRWRCLTKRIDVNPTFVPQVVLACAILHNFVEQQKESYLETWAQSALNIREFRQPQDTFSSEIIFDDNVDPKHLRNNLKNFLKDNFPLKTTYFNY
ncbi:protein ALP1-like [Rhagoletis pomonella]|uniref:protein ALP1-like n=1 Tax=Rhagoletis pomonella TaxID=28610 RepID=UPI001784A6D0|nr:protein ALP1-like [Rhagoletis pomonella]XP_036342373.1 protein ALP1-like [Rhagoletis pomonella]